MKKISSKAAFGVSLLLLLILFQLSACMNFVPDATDPGDDPTNTPQQPTVVSIVFDPSNGDNVTEITVTEGEKAALPEAPAKTGFEFAGWYRDHAKWNFDDPVSESMTLIAKWKHKSFTVNFDSDGGSSVAPAKVFVNDTLDRPELPTKEGYDLVGWYNGEERWNFISDTVTEDVTLTAKWEPSGPYKFDYEVIDPENIELRSFKIPEGVTEFVIPETVDGYYVTKIPRNMITSSYPNENSVTRIVLPQTVESIDAFAFSSCYNLEEINFPEGLKNLHCEAFSEKAPVIKEENGILYVNNWAIGAANPKYGEIQPREGTVGIAASAFSQHISDVTVTLPKGLKYIGSSAFAGFNNLKEITIPEGVTYIGYNAFSNCSKLEKAILPSTLQYLGDDAFYHNLNLSYVSDIPESVTYLGSGAFEDCYALQSIVIKANITEIKETTFKDCMSLTSVDLPDSLLRIEQGAFDECGAAVTVNGIYYVDGWAIGCDEGIQEIILEDNTVGIADFAFSDSENIVKITIPEGISVIPQSAFENCKRVYDIKLPKTLKRIEDKAFSKCERLQRIEIPMSVEYIGSYAFYDTLLQKLVLPESLTIIGASAFGSTGIDAVVIPINVVSIGTNAFASCSNLSSIIFEDMNGWHKLFSSNALPGNTERAEMTSADFENVQKLVSDVKKLQLYTSFIKYPSAD